MPSWGEAREHTKLWLILVCSHSDMPTHRVISILVAKQNKQLLNLHYSSSHNEVSNLYPSNLAQTSGKKICRKWFFILRSLPICKGWARWAWMMSGVWDRSLAVPHLLQNVKGKKKEKCPKMTRILLLNQWFIVWNKNPNICAEFANFTL